MAGMLHSFYGGMENILKRIYSSPGSAVLEGGMWHMRLLEISLKSDHNPRGVISKDLYTRIKKYLEFRHVFRHAYSFELQWKKMFPLIDDCRPTFIQFKKEILEACR
jgi:hypothetical protein